MSDKSPSRERLIEERRNQILDAAALLFARKGYKGATIREIAREAGVAEGTIYNYFDSKHDLLISLPQRISWPLVSSFVKSARRQGPDTVADDEEQMAQLLQASMSSMQQHTDAVKVLLAYMPFMDEEIQAQFLEQTTRFFTRIFDFEGFLQARIKTGTFRPFDTAIAARAFVGMVLIFVLSQEILPGRKVIPMSYEEIAREVVRLFLYGAVARPEESES
ncbi:MAG: TetR/AcrR family transcriptional regulator [Anaerolineae bacterium]|nr:TetR/AcrR family transcriptional regulator [Anaerolineae bacterium]